METAWVFSQPTDMGAKTGGDFKITLSNAKNNALCKNARSFDISVTKP